MKSTNLVELLKQGKKPLVKLLNETQDGEGWGEKGMLARILSWHYDVEDVIAFEFDYNENKTHNLALQGNNYHVYDHGAYKGLGTAFEANFIKNENDIHETVYYVTHGNGSDVPVEIAEGGLITEYMDKKNGIV